MAERSALTDVLSLVNPEAFDHASRVRRLVRGLAQELDVAELWRLEIAAMLSQVGCVAVPNEMLERTHSGKQLSASDRSMLEQHPAIGRELIANIPRLQEVAEIIAQQERRFDDPGAGEDGSGDAATLLGARVLKLALDADALMLAGATEGMVLDEIRRRRGWYDPEVVGAFERAFEARTFYEQRNVHIDDLTVGMVIAQDVRADGVLLIGQGGQEVSRALIARLRNYNTAARVDASIQVLMPLSQASYDRDAA